MRTITGWSINVVWSDGEEQVLTDMPSWVAKEVDNWLTDLEEEVNADETTEGEEE